MYYALNISDGRLWLESGIDVGNVNGQSTKLIFEDSELLALKWDIQRILKRIEVAEKKLVRSAHEN